jgi:hypothetical protein
MNLQEDINRIKEVMGINENQNHFFIRRQDEFIEDIINSFEWMDIEDTDSDSFEEYVEEILRHAIDSLFQHNDILVTNEEIDELLPLALKILRNDERLFKKIKSNYINYRITSRIDESKELLLVKRRMDALLDYIEQSYDWLSPRRFDNFEHFLKRVVFSAARDFVADEIGGEYEEQLNIREELEPMILELVKKLPIYDEIYDHYISNI